jgi:hypothetical protein
LEYAKKLKTMIEDRLQIETVYLSDVFSGCGTNIGPGMVAVYFFGDELTEGLTKEKEMMTALING